MIRNTLDAGGGAASTLLTPTNGINLDWRISANGSTSENGILSHDRSILGGASTQLW